MNAGLVSGGVYFEWTRDGAVGIGLWVGEQVIVIVRDCDVHDFL